MMTAERIATVRAMMKAALDKAEAVDRTNMTVAEKYALDIEMKRLLDEYLDFEDSVRQLQAMVGRPDNNESK